MREVSRELSTANRQANATVTLRLDAPRILDATSVDLDRTATSAVGGATWLYGAASIVATAAAGTVTTIPAGAAVVTGPTTLRAHPSDPDRPTRRPGTLESYLIGGQGVFSVLVDRGAINVGGLLDGVRVDPMVPHPGTLFGLPSPDAPFRAGSGEPVSLWANLHHVAEAAQAQVRRWTLNEAALEVWAAVPSLEAVDELHERVAAEVRCAPGDDRSRTIRHRAETFQTDLVDRKGVTLALAARRAESTDEVRAFAVAGIERGDATPRPIDEHVGLTLWNERSVGEWGQLLVTTPSHVCGDGLGCYEGRGAVGVADRPAYRRPCSRAHRAGSTRLLAPSFVIASERSLRTVP